MNTTVSTAQPITQGEQILFNRPNSLVVCAVTQISEKAVCVDYAVEPISMYSNSPIVVYCYRCWIPKSVIIADTNGGLTVKKWFAAKWTGGKRIKKYYLENGKKCFV